MRALIVEDNFKLAQAVQKGLAEQGFSPDIAPTGDEAADLASRTEYELIILDLMLPDRDGIALCRDLRARGVKSKVLMLTALSSTQDKVTGLDAGADDYLAKPFEFDELLARIRALLRRGDSADSRILKCGDLELDRFTRIANRAGTAVELSNKEFGLLEFFMRHQDRVLTRAEIGEEIWDINLEPASNVVDVYVSNLRKKIDRGFERELIHTVKGTGYLFGVTDVQ